MDDATSQVATKLSREDDHLGLIGRNLLELTGYEAMAFELIQNADDNQAATWLRFDVRDEALWVEDDGGFSDCGRQNLRPDGCPFIAARGHRCDFHSFRLKLNSGADKRNRDDTTGAMGIGFTSVYQVTDRPEILSASRHWVIDETQPQDDRIDQFMLDAPHGGTRIVLPWGKDRGSDFRTRANVAPAPADVDLLVAEALNAVVPPAMLFLRRLDRIEIARNGDVERTVTRVIDGDRALIDDAGETQEWRLLRGEFEDVANELRRRFEGQLEATRSASVAVAVPVDGDVVGKLCATLPTATPTGLPLHVCADLIVTSDRRRPRMAPAHETAWNEAAIDCAGRVIAEHVADLPEMLGPKRLWTLIEAAWTLGQSSSDDPVDVAQRAYWERIEPELARDEIVWTSADEMALLEDARIAGESVRHVVQNLELVECADGRGPSRPTSTRTRTR